MKKLLLILFSSLFLFGCEDYLDINTDPNNPSDVDISQLLPYAQLSGTRALTSGYGIGQNLTTYVHHTSTREPADEYRVTGGNYWNNRAWYTFYVYANQNLVTMMDKAEELGANKYLGIGKILSAYYFSQFVDLYGEIPYSEAALFKDGIAYANFEAGEVIYPQLIELLDDAIADFNTEDAEGVLAPGSDDLIYGGNLDLWIKAANTIKLKLYNQIRKVQDVSQEVSQLISGDNLISSTSESMMFRFTDVNVPDERHPAYVDNYAATQKAQYMSPWFYEILKGYNSWIYTGIEDPRIPYYFYNQITPGQAGREGNNTEYRDGGFVSIYFGSNGNDRDASQDGTMTVFGIYPCGGIYDDGGAIAVDGASGTGAAPYRYLTYADRLYIEAELINAGIIDGDVDQVVESAVSESFAMVDFVVGLANDGQTIPVLEDSEGVNDYINDIMNIIENEDSDGKLQHIITQKWISSFGSNYVDLYSDYRRTGYPELFDPSNPDHAPGGYVTPPDSDPDRDDPVAVPVSVSLNYPRSLPWSADELNVNQNAPAQKSDPSQYRVFWDVE